MPLWMKCGIHCMRNSCTSFTYNLFEGYRQGIIICASSFINGFYIKLKNLTFCAVDWLRNIHNEVYDFHIQRKQVMENSHATRHSSFQQRLHTMSGLKSLTITWLNHVWQWIITAESSMLFSLKEHYPFCWRLYHLMLIRGCGLSTVAPLATFHTMYIEQTDVSNGDPTVCPPRSHDHNSIFFLQGCMKKNYATEVQDWKNLKNHILVAVTNIRGQSRQLVNVRESIQHSCEAYIWNGGSNSELSCEEIHRTAYKSSLHDHTLQLYIM